MTDEFEFDPDKYASDIEDLGEPELILFYGPYGGGKTYMALSASEIEDLAPILVLDLEGSTTGVVDNFDKSKITVIRPKDKWPGKEWRSTKALLTNLLTKSHKYKTVIIDPVNTMFEWGKNEGHNPGDGFAKWNFVHDEFTNDGGLFDLMKKAPFLAVLVLHEAKSGSADEDGVQFADFRWQGQGTGLLGQYPDIIGYVTRDTDLGGRSVSTLFTSPTKRNNAKNRFGLPYKMLNPNMAEIYKVIRSKKEDK